MDDLEAIELQPVIGVYLRALPHSSSTWCHLPLSFANTIGQLKRANRVSLIFFQLILGRIEKHLLLEGHLLSTCSSSRVQSDGQSVVVNHNFAYIQR